MTKSRDNPFRMTTRNRVTPMIEQKISFKQANLDWAREMADHNGLSLNAFINFIVQAIRLRTYEKESNMTITDAVIADGRVDIKVNEDAVADIEIKKEI